MDQQPLEAADDSPSGAGEVPPGGSQAPPAEGSEAASSAASGSVLIPPAVPKFTDATPLTDIMHWAGIPADPFRDSVMAALGDPSHVRDVAHITELEWAEFVNSDFVRIPTGDEGSHAQIAASAVQKARLRACRQAACEAIGLPSVDPVRPGVTLAPLQAAPASSEPPPKRLRMSQLVDVTADTECPALSNEKINAMFASYRDTRGDLPHPDIEPTADQLSAIYQLLVTNAPPYVDFSIFGPHGRRFIRKMTFLSYTFQPADGTLKRQELPGPSSFIDWWRSWVVLKTALLLLGAVQPERLDAYGEHVRTLNDRFGADTWFIIYQADARMRQEEFERIHRRAVMGRTPGFDPQKPWDTVFRIAVDEPKFWDTEVRDKAIMYLTRIASAAQTLDDGTIDAPASLRSHQGGRSPSNAGKGKNRGGHGKGSPQGAQPGKRGKGGKQHNGSTSGDNRGSAAMETCRMYNAGTCTRTPCPSGRRHICSSCGGNHPATECRSGGKGGKSAKGKGGGGKPR